MFRFLYKNSLLTPLISGVYNHPLERIAIKNNDAISVMITSNSVMYGRTTPQQTVLVLYLFMNQLQTSDEVQ